MKKPVISLFLFFSLVLGIVQPAQALNLKERAQAIKQKTIELFQKGGAKSKELWNKINFLGRAIKEVDEATKDFKLCRKKYCTELRKAMVKAGEKNYRCESDSYCRLSQQYNELHKNYWMAATHYHNCPHPACAAKLKRLIEARHNLGLATLGTVFLVNIAVIGATLVGAGAVALAEEDLKEKTEEEVSQQPSWQESPAYRKPLTQEEFEIEIEGLKKELE